MNKMGVNMVGDHNLSGHGADAKGTVETSAGAHGAGSGGPTVSEPLCHERDLLRGADDLLADFDRGVRVFNEIISGCRGLFDLGRSVTVFGSARLPEDHHWYQLAREIGRELAQIGCTVITGGGPGIMEAANRGAHEQGGASIGCNIRLPHEQHPNRFLDRVMTFDYFYVRKLMLLKYSSGFIFMPGGFGTFDELFETLTLIQTGKLQAFPCVAVGTPFWRPLIEQAFERLYEEGVVRPEEVGLALLDDPAEIMAHLQAAWAEAPSA